MQTAADRAETVPLDRALLASAARAAAIAALAEKDAAKAIEDAVEALHAGAARVFPSVFMLEHGRLWLVAQRGYTVVPDGIEIQRGIMGRAVRARRGQLVADVHTDLEYVEGLPSVTAELAVPLLADGVVIGVLNLDSEQPFPEDALALVEPLTAAVAEPAEALRSATRFDLSALARLFVYLGSLRDPEEIAGLAVASLARILPVEVCQLWTWDQTGAFLERASWRSEPSTLAPLSAEELEAMRAHVDPAVVCQVLDLGASGSRTGLLVWLPLRAKAEDIGVLIGATAVETATAPAQLDSAALLAAHVAASLDAALALRRERESAETDLLTGILNRRGLEQRLDSALAEAQEQRIPLSLVVFDCDDFKDVNDRAGHEFGDALLREVAEVLARSVPESSVVARLGGDEFVVVLPGEGVEGSQGLAADIRATLTAGLAEAGFPLHLSAGVSTYPFDGAGATTLLRSADQALYAAKNGGKDRVASFRSIVLPEQPASPTAVAVVAPDDRSGRHARRDGSVLAEAVSAANAIEAEEAVDAILARLCKSLVFVVGATACSASRVTGEYLVDAARHALRQVWLGDEAAYRISDFPLTEEALRTGEPRTVSFLDPPVDPAEAFILRELEMNAMLMLPLHVDGRAWGLVELYEMRLRRFTEDDVSVAQFLTTHAVRRLEAVGYADEPPARPPVYELPPESRSRTPRTR
jgi:diguanylate cyclase (GGDEF)-like protein